MSGSTPTNNSAVQFEQQQAAEADQKEAARQASLQQGQTLIDQIFNGSPVMGTKTNNFDWSTFNPAADLSRAASTVGGTVGSNLPAGYTAVQVAAPAAASSAGGRGAATGTPSYNVAPSYSTSVRGQTTLNPTAASVLNRDDSGTAWAIKGPDGKIYNQGDPLSYDTTYDTGQKTGGFDDNFYNSYRQKVLDYYNPDEAKQYSEAQRDLTYNLARAGTLQSSTAADKQGDLAYNDALQKANIVANANQQTGQLQNQIQANKESLVNQLYATDDPTLTANLAESSAKASQLQDPTLTPAAALFTPAMSAVGSAVSSYLNPYSPVAQGAGGGGVSSPTPASSNTSSGKVVYG